VTATRLSDRIFLTDGGIETTLIPVGFGPLPVKIWNGMIWSWLE
jgi:hypothetical protein